MSHQCTLAIVGDGAVGKSSIIATFKSDGFARVYKQTVGCDFYEKVLQLRGETVVSLRVWDIGGQSINSKNLREYLSASTMVFLVYDVTNKDSLENLNDWLRMVRKYALRGNLMLIGNKIDLIGQRQVSDDEHYEFMRDNGIPNDMFVSAKSGENVLKAFYKGASESIGLRLTAHELAYYDKVLKAHIGAENEGRTIDADDIEEQDRLAEERKQKKNNGGCCVS